MLLLLLSLPGLGQQDPALEVATRQLVQEYLALGPREVELADNAAKGSWAMLEKIGIPEFLLQDSLKLGAWGEVLAPLKLELDKRGFEGTSPLDALAWWDESKGDHKAFLRFLASSNLIDLSQPKDRARGEALRKAIDADILKLNEVRVNVRFEHLKWSFTGTASLVPAQRVVRLVLRGSQPCPVSGQDRVVELALKGKFGLDLTRDKGLAVRIIESNFSSSGCEQKVACHLSGVLPLTAGGEARLSGRLSLVLKDDIITGRIQLDVASRTPGKALQLSHATYSVRGAVDGDGAAHAVVTSVSVSGAERLSEGLGRAGVLEALFTSKQGVGTLMLPAFTKSLVWRVAFRP